MREKKPTNKKKEFFLPFTAMRKSVARARRAPPAMACPLTAAIVGAGKVNN
jgi:hypothetical protein